MDENGSKEDGDVDQAWPKSSLERLDYSPDRRRRLLDLSYNDRVLRSDGEFVYPQRQFARTELVVPGGGGGGGGGLEVEEEEDEGGDGSCRPAADDAVNCNGRTREDLVYDDFLPNIRGTFARFDGLESRSGYDRSLSGEAAPEGVAAPVEDDDQDGAEAVEDGREETEEPTLKETSRRGEGGTGRGGGSVDSSIMKLIRSLGMMNEPDRPSGAPIEGDAEGGGGGGAAAAEGRLLDQESFDRVTDKVDNWINNQGQLIEAAFRRGTESSQKRLKLLTQQLTTCKQRLFEVSRDRQAIMTYVRRYERNWTCRQERLRMEILRLQKNLHDSQKSSAQLEENRQLYEGESGSPRLKTEETLDKVLAVVVEHQNKINELKLTVFAQQQHILSLEEERQNNALLSLAIDDKTTCEQSGCKESSENEEDRAQDKKEVPKPSDNQAKSPAAAAESSLPVATLTESVDGRCCTSKMSDVLLCDEGEYALCQANQPEAATDEAITNLRCLCHQHGASCGNFAQVHLVGHLPYLMDSPLDTEVAGVLARQKIRPFAVADLPYVRQRTTAGRTPQENVQFEFDVFK